MGNPGLTQRHVARACCSLDNQSWEYHTAYVIRSHDLSKATELVRCQMEFKPKTSLLTSWKVVNMFTCLSQIPKPNSDTYTVMYVTGFFLRLKRSYKAFSMG